jgi:hypothetical protein
MTVELHWSIPVPVKERTESRSESPASRKSPGAGRLQPLRPIGRWLWSFLVNAISGSADSGIDETQFMSGYNVPYRKGSRMVRNLWHQPF